MCASGSGKEFAGGVGLDMILCLPAHSNHAMTVGTKVRKIMKKTSPAMTRAPRVL